MNKAKQRGVALILALILLLVLSVMGVSLMFLSQSETWSSLNYRLMSQARDGAEAGVNKAANYLINKYTPPAATGADLLSNYTLTASPVTYSGAPVVLSANSYVSPNYPVSSVQDSFKAAGKGSLMAGSSRVNYLTSATLLNMRQLTVGCLSPTQATVQTWLITSDGNISGVRNAQVEVSAILEQLVTPCFNYAAFATNNGCNALTFGGGGSTDSYDSSTVVNGTVTTQLISGNVGTNGNLSESGSTTTINGTLSTPRTGVGTCTTSNVTAWTDKQGKVTGGLVELPQPINYPNPAIPSPGTQDLLKLDKNWKCPSGINAIPGCSTDGNGNITIDAKNNGGTISLGDISFNAGSNLHLTAGTYNINSLSEAGNGTLTIDSGPVILNVAGYKTTNFNPSSSAVVDLTGNSVTNASLIPTNFQILYAGTGTVKLAGNSQASGLLYAPNASFSFTGGSSWYGAVIGAFMTDMGGTAVHYDRQLQKTDFIVGSPMLSSFTWKKY